MAPATDHSVPGGASKVHKENNCHSESIPSSPHTLQSYTKTQCHINSVLVRDGREVQHTC